MLTRMLVLTLASGLGAWGGWRLGEGWGLLPAFLCANVGFAIAWYYARKFVRENLD